MFPRKNRVARLVEQLRTPDEAVQHEAIEALESLSDSRITTQEAHGIRSRPRAISPPRGAGVAATDCL